MKQSSCRRDKPFLLPSRWGCIGFWRVVGDAGGGTEGNLVPQQLLEALLIKTPSPCAGVRRVSCFHGNAGAGCAVTCKRRKQPNPACSSWVGRAASSGKCHLASSERQQRQQRCPGTGGRRGRPGERRSRTPVPRRAVPAALGQSQSRQAVAERSPSCRVGMSGDHSRSLGKGKRLGAGTAHGLGECGGGSPSALLSSPLR